MEEKEVGFLNAEDVMASSAEGKNQEVFRVRDCTDNLRELIGLVKENYLIRHGTHGD